MGRIVTSRPCPLCRAEGRDRQGDNLKVYEDGSGYCWAGHGYLPLNKQFDKEEEEDILTLDEVATLPIAPLKKRGLRLQQSEKFKVRIEYNPADGTEYKYYFPLYADGALVGYQTKLARAPGERQKGDVERLVAQRGASANAAPFGSEVAGNEGRFLIVVEGAEDAMAADAMLNECGKSWRVVGALGTDTWKRNLEWYMGFEKVVVAFDPDVGGKKAAAEFADALAGKAFIADLPVDPNAMLISGMARQFLAAVSNAKPFTPAGFIMGEQVWERMKNYVKPTTLDYPEEWYDLREKMEGIRLNEISLWTGGSSVGKTSYIRRLKQHFLQTQPSFKIAEIELEESPEKTFRGLMQFHAGRKWTAMSSEEKRQVYKETYGTGRIITLDHRSYNKDSGGLLKKMYHAHYSLGCQVVFLDHITLAVTEFGDGDGGNSNQDQMMSDFLTFVEKVPVHLCIVSHLRKTGQGSRDYEQGAVPSKADLKGSGSLSQISFDIVGVSRNMMHENVYERNVSQMHVLKCRETGHTGPSDRMYWDEENQQLIPAKVEKDF